MMAIGNLPLNLPDGYYWLELRTHYPSIVHCESGELYFFGTINFISWVDIRESEGVTIVPIPSMNRCMKIERTYE